MSHACLSRWNQQPAKPQATLYAILDSLSLRDKLTVNAACILFQVSCKGHCPGCIAIQGWLCDFSRSLKLPTSIGLISCDMGTNLKKLPADMHLLQQGHMCKRPCAFTNSGRACSKTLDKRARRHHPVCRYRILSSDQQEHSLHWLWTAAAQGRNLCQMSDCVAA